MFKNLLILFVFAISAEASNIPIEVGQAISEALKGKWIFQNFDKMKMSIGFDSMTSLSDISAGDPFQLFCISQMDFEEAQDDIPIDSLLKPEDWYVPLYVDGKLMQTVMLIGTRFGEKEKWSAGIRSLGELVKAWQRIKEVWPEGKGYHPKLVLIAEPMEHNLCLYIPEKEPHNLTIIGNLYGEFKPITNGLSYKELVPSKETFRGIKARIDKSTKKGASLWAEKKRINDSLAILRELATEHLWKKYETKEPVISKSAVTSWWNNRLVEADEAIIPSNMRIAQFVGEDDSIDHEIDVDNIKTEFSGLSFKQSRYREPLQFFSAAMIFRDSEISFFYMYKVLEYFFWINRKKEIQTIASKWIKYMDKLSVKIGNIYKTDEKSCLLYLLKNPQLKGEVKKAEQIAFKNGLIPSKSPEELANKLYLFRNSIVHGKSDVGLEIRTPSLFLDFKESPWYSIIHILAFGCIREFCYDGYFWKDHVLSRSSSRLAAKAILSP
jgi:hypothetical protein